MQFQAQAMTTLTKITVSVALTFAGFECSALVEQSEMVAKRIQSTPHDHSTVKVLTPKRNATSLLPSNTNQEDSVLPSAEQVIDDYIVALGGTLQLNALELVTMKGKIVERRDWEDDEDSDLTFEWRYVGSHYLNTHHSNGVDHHFGFDGTTKWRSTGESDHADIDNLKQDSIYMSRSPTQVLGWLEDLQRVTVHGITEIEGRKTLELHFNVYGDQIFKRYFDLETKLMVREAIDDNVRIFKYEQHEDVVFFSEITIEVKGNFYNRKILSGFNIEPEASPDSIKFPERFKNFNEAERKPRHEIIERFRR